MIKLSEIQSRAIGKTGTLWGEDDDFFARQDFPDGSAWTWTTTDTAYAFVDRCKMFERGAASTIVAYIRTDDGEIVKHGDEILSFLEVQNGSVSRVRLVAGGVRETLMWTAAETGGPWPTTGSVLDPRSGTDKPLGVRHLRDMANDSATPIARQAIADALSGVRLANDA